MIEDHGCKKINFMAGFEHTSFRMREIGIFKKVLEQNDLVFEPERLAYDSFGRCRQDTPVKNGLQNGSVENKVCRKQ